MKVLQTFCTRNEQSKATANGRTDRNAMRLFPGEVGLRGDRATFHLGRAGPAPSSAAGQPSLTPDNRKPTGAVYYNMRPMTVIPSLSSGKPGGKQQQAAAAAAAAAQQPQRKHVMQMLPALPTSTEQAVGPVTGLPIAGDEHVFVLRLGKRYNEPDEKARLQIEVRLPKQQEPVSTDVDTQYMDNDVLIAKVDSKKKAKGKKTKKNADGKKAKNNAGGKKGKK